MSKIVSTNFSTHQSYDLHKVRLLLTAILMLLFFGFIFLINVIYGLEENIIKVKNKRNVLQYEHKIVQRAAESVPDYSTLKEIERKVAVVKEIASTKGNISIKLLGVIEEILPENAALTGFYHKTDIGDIDITISANDTLSLTAFVHSLEKSEEFGQVLITRQSHQEQESDTVVYDIRIIQDDDK